MSARLFSRAARFITWGIYFILRLSEAQILHHASGPRISNIAPVQEGGQI